MNKSGIAIATVGAIQLVLSSILLFFFAQTSGTSFSTYWSASGWTIWYPQYVAGATLVVVVVVILFVTPGETGKSRGARYDDTR